MIGRTAAAVAALLVLAAGPAGAYQIPAEPVGCTDDGMRAVAVDGGVRIIDRTREPNVATYRVDGVTTPAKVIGQADCVSGYTADVVRLRAADSGARVRVAEFAADGSWLSTSWLRVHNR